MDEIEFIEQFLGMKLKFYQKILLKKYNFDIKIPRHNNEKAIRLLIDKMLNGENNNE
ncbi:hypothetical protein QTH47_13020 [Clostridium perfringens]|uniref:hypothetical protein n=1 Tax=Clostridium perfringens TaxID=1502 RepID=UPI0018E4C0BD|nr:hypothetical protein [Clostridium perfringens]MBI6005910.1 hypothetical protein [Clostridium perfringens]MDM0660040.1 hypothetical protein [Clostridium perfringens]